MHALTLPPPWDDEAAAVAGLRQQLSGTLDWSVVRPRSLSWVTALRAQTPHPLALEALLQSYPLSSAEGLALMRLAEALLRIPDRDTLQLLLGDQLAQGDWQRHAPSVRPAWWEPLSTRVMQRIRQVMDTAGNGNAPGGLGAPLHALTQRLEQGTIVWATLRAVQLLGRQFVLAPEMPAAWQQAQKAGPGVRWSFDMLGEGARAPHDAERYCEAYRFALQTLAAAGPAARDQGISIKLSALHPRFEPSQADVAVPALRDRLLPLCELAATHKLAITLDAEESDRLEVQLAVLADVLAHLPGRVPDDWSGLGLAVQAYQFRAPAVVQQVIALAERHRCRLGVRLVKGAYWDTEIKRAQEAGWPAYPVFTRKAHTDLCYLACAATLLQHTQHVYPQFATHNATTIAAVLALAARAGVPATDYEWQRLHGMGEQVHDTIRRDLAPEERAPLRIYAPVGPHRDLLAYLVRRLLENGANTSFVRQVGDPDQPLEPLIRSPLLDDVAPLPTLPPPVLAWQGPHPQAPGRDLNHAPHRQAIAAAIEARRALHAEPTGNTLATPPGDVPAIMAALHDAWPAWEAQPADARIAVLLRVADTVAREFDSWVADLVLEAGKTPADAVAEVRETIDYARYYAEQARQQLGERLLPGPTGEHNSWRLRGRGVFVCIAPWNFPLAIFGGQVMAALVMGNAVAAKPAPQTPKIAARFVATLHACGVPEAVLAPVPGGADVGEALVAHARCAGVAFTGSVRAAKQIQRTLSDDARPIVPLIAETGGLNAMVVDTSALPEQVVDTVLHSTFHSAGQRCSALRLLCLHTDTADEIETMLGGALQTLRVGPAEDWRTDVGPVIDARAQARLLAHVAALRDAAQSAPGEVVCLGELTLAPALAASQDPVWVAPSIWRLPTVSALAEEHFGPILHVVHWGPGTAAPDLETLLAQINACGYGLTLGLHTRIDARMRIVAQHARVGNIYVNRGMTGAVVGVQPFGGQGWSGSGPKAGGPLYLPRFATEQVVSINTAAAGGNAALLSQFAH